MRGFLKILLVRTRPVVFLGAALVTVPCGSVRAQSCAEGQDPPAETVSTELKKGFEELKNVIDVPDEALAFGEGSLEPTPSRTEQNDTDPFNIMDDSIFEDLANVRSQVDGSRWFTYLVQSVPNINSYLESLEESAEDVEDALDEASDDLEDQRDALIRSKADLQQDAERLQNEYDRRIADLGDRPGDRSLLDRGLGTFIGLNPFNGGSSDQSEWDDAHAALEREYPAQLQDLTDQMEDLDKLIELVIDPVLENATSGNVEDADAATQVMSALGEVVRQVVLDIIPFNQAGDGVLSALASPHAAQTLEKAKATINAFLAAHAHWFATELWTTRVAIRRCETEKFYEPCSDFDSEACRLVAEVIRQSVTEDDLDTGDIENLDAFLDGDVELAGVADSDPGSLQVDPDALLDTAVEGRANRAAAFESDGVYRITGEDSRGLGQICFDLGVADNQIYNDGGCADILLQHIRTQVPGVTHETIPQGVFIDFSQVDLSAVGG